VAHHRPVGLGIRLIPELKSDARLSPF
jgi:hypothetical protein